MNSLARDWPAYAAVGGFICFAAYAIIETKRQERDKKRQEKSSNQDAPSPKGSNR